MNKPKWLELIWLVCWMSPPIVVAAIVSQIFHLSFAGKLSVAVGLLTGWFTLIIVWSRLK